MKLDPRHITPAEAEQMYSYWTNGPDGKMRPIREVMAKFNRSRSAIYRARKKYNWNERYQAAVAKMQAKTDDKVEKKKATTHDVLHGAMMKIAKAILDKDVLLENITTEEFVKLATTMNALARTVLQLEGKLPDEKGDRAGDCNIGQLVVYYANLPDDERKRVDSEWDRVFGLSGAASNRSRF